MEKVLLKPTEVAETLRIGRSLVYEMLACGELPSIRVGRCIRVPRVSLDRWISEQENKTPSRVNEVEAWPSLGGTDGVNGERRREVASRRACGGKRVCELSGGQEWRP